MKYLLILLFVLYVSVGYGQTSSYIFEELREELNDSLFSHFCKGDSVKLFYASTHKRVRDERRIKYDEEFDSFLCNLFVGKELGQCLILEKVDLKL